MTFTFRVVLIVVCGLTCWYTLRKIRKSQMQIEDSLFWIILSFGLAGISIFPRAAEYMAEMLGILSPANFVFLAVIFLLLMKVFTLTLKYSQLEEKLKRLVQRLTIEEGKRRGREGSSDAVREGEKESPAAAALDSTKVKNEESTEMICGGGGRLLTVLKTAPGLGRPALRPLQSGSETGAASARTDTEAVQQAAGTGGGPHESR